MKFTDSTLSPAMTKNKKSVDYSQFLDLENDDEDFASSVPVSKKSRLEPKREKKDKAPKKPKDETSLPKEESSSPKNSQSKRLPLDDKIYRRDLEVALALSVQETSVIIENDENTPRNVSPAFFPSESKDPEVSFSNCSVDSSILGLDEITENKEEPVNGRSRRQAASKAIKEQRKLLKDDSSGEEDADEFRPDSAVYEDSDSDESYSGDDEEFEVKKSKKAGTSQVPKAKKEKKVKNTPKARRKDENDGSVSEDEEFDIMKSKKSAGSKWPKAKSEKKENNVPLSKTASVSSPAPVSIKIKPITAKPTTASSPGSTKPNGHGSRPVGMKRPAWSPPASSGSVGSPVTGLTVRSPNQGLRLGLSRLARIKPLHPASVLH